MAAESSAGPAGGVTPPPTDGRAIGASAGPSDQLVAVLAALTVVFAGAFAMATRAAGRRSRRRV